MKTQNKEDKKHSHTGDKFSKKIKERVNKSYEKEFGRHKGTTKRDSE